MSESDIIIIGSILSIFIFKLIISELTLPTALFQHPRFPDMKQIGTQTQRAAVMEASKQTGSTCSISKKQMLLADQLAVLHLFVTK